MLTRALLTFRRRNAVVKRYQGNANHSEIELGCVIIYLIASWREELLPCRHGGLDLADVVAVARAGVQDLQQEAADEQLRTKRTCLCLHGTLVWHHVDLLSPYSLLYPLYPSSRCTKGHSIMRRKNMWVMLPKREEEKEEENALNGLHYHKVGLKLHGKKGETWRISLMTNCVTEYGLFLFDWPRQLFETSVF